MTLWWLTGGRPMIHIREEFMDHVEYCAVHSYMDRCGRFWYAIHRWALFRVRMDGTAIMRALSSRR